MIAHDHVGEQPALVVNICELIDGEWYWVRGFGGEWFPAKWDASFGEGRFMNDDTWEDMRGEITEWIHIPFPSE